MSNIPALFPERFSLVVGGPFHTLLRHCGLIGADLLPTWRAAALLALLAWSIPVTLAVAQTRLDSNYSGLDIFTDGTVFARYLLAVWAMLATERFADGRITLLMRYFADSNLLREEVRHKFAEAMVQADRRSSSATAEVLILAIALAWSITMTRYVSGLEVTGWEGYLDNSSIRLSWAGEATAFISNPLFLFLGFRWIWRFLVWAALLFRIAGLPLQLMPLHPDRAGGLGFLTIFPTIFSGFVFALGCVAAATMNKALAYATYSQQAIGLAIAAWLVFMLVLVFGPLLAFVRPLYMARERALLQYGRLAHNHHLGFHRKWLDEGGSGEELLGSADPSSVSDLNASVQAALEMKIFPVTRTAVLQIAVVAGIPFLGVALAQMRFVDLVSLMLGAIL